ncbi:MAG: 3'-5' exonuclease domain-containing protein 2 [Bacteroidales bacterium]|nr:3'-5' exonuclease domain-containing protein 2 [Bacteroidales bacterium]
MYKEDITKEELAELENKAFEGTVFVVDTIEQVEEACLVLNNSPVLGFDTETRPSFKKGKQNHVALLQLSNQQKAYIFRLHKLGLPDCLAELLASEKQKKIGVAIRDDIKALQKLKPFTSDGFVELQTYTSDLGIKSNSLKKLAALILGFSVSKRQRLSNWESDPLTEAQIRYAATDAWVCHEIYSKLQDNLKYNQ